MIASKSLFATFTAVAAVSAYVVPRTQAPAGWWTEGLEDYTSYHTRYLALNCQNQHGTSFFDLCCHPLKANETLETARPPECVPSWTAAVSACQAEPSSTVSTPDDSTPASVTAASPATSTAAAVSEASSAPADATPSPISNVATDPNNGEDDDDETCNTDGEDDGDEEDDEEFCDEDDGEDEGASSSAPSSTAAPEASSTSAAAPAPTDSQGANDDGEDEDESCDEDGDDGDDSSSFAPTSTPAPEATESPAPESTPEPVVNPAPAPSSSEVASSEAPGPSSSEASSSSERPAPTSSSSSTFAPENTPEPSSSKSSSAAESNPTSSSSGQVFTGGVATFFYQDNTAGACGDVHSDSDLVAAIDAARYGNTGQKSDLCGRQVKITNTQNNKEVTVTIADACPTCENENSIDLSTGAFDQIADESEGVVPISWQFV